jgi:hypothetical protein
MVKRLFFLGVLLCGMTVCSAQSCGTSLGDDNDGIYVSSTSSDQCALSGGGHIGPLVVIPKVPSLSSAGDHPVWVNHRLGASSIFGVDDLVHMDNSINRKFGSPDFDRTWDGRKCQISRKELA